MKDTTFKKRGFSFVRVEEQLLVKVEKKKTDKTQNIKAEKSRRKNIFFIFLMKTSRQTKICAELFIFQILYHLS